MAAPIPPHKWSWYYDACVVCGTTGKTGNAKHSCKGLCVLCYDRKRSREENKEKRKEIHDRYRNKIKSSPELLKQYNEYQRVWRKTSPSYRAFFEKQKMKLRFQRFVKDYFENPDKPLQRRHQGTKVCFEYNEKDYCFITPLKNINDRNIDELDLFRIIVNKYLELKALDNQILDN